MAVAAEWKPIGGIVTAAEAEAEKDRLQPGAGFAQQRKALWIVGRNALARTQRKQYLA